MHSLTWIFVIGCTVLLFTATRAERFRCYSCSGSGCEDEFNAAGVHIEDNCRTCTKKISEGIGMVYTTRLCGYIPEKERCEEGDGFTFCTCNSELCNGSTTIVASALVMGVFTAVALMLKKF